MHILNTTWNVISNNTIDRTVVRAVVKGMNNASIDNFVIKTFVPEEVVQSSNIELVIDFMTKSKVNLKSFPRFKEVKFFNKVWCK